MDVAETCHADGELSDATSSEPGSSPRAKLGYDVLDLLEEFSADDQPATSSRSRLGGSKDGEKLLEALRSADARAVASLLKARPSLVSEPVQDGKEPLIIAVELLVDQGATVGQEAEARPASVREIAELLLTRQANPNSEAPPLGESPLQIALRAGTATSGPGVTLPFIRRFSQLRVATALLRASADPNHTDMMGEGPLTEAVCALDLEVCELLLSNGADPKAKNVNGQCAMDLAHDAKTKKYLGDAMRRHSTEHYEVLWERGNDAFDEERYADAEQNFTAALKLKPDCAELLLNHALACTLLGEFEQAYSDSLKAIELDPSNAQAHECRARCFLHLDRLQEGSEACGRHAQSLRNEQVDSEEWQPFLNITRRIKHHLVEIRKIERRLADCSDDEREETTSTCLSWLKNMTAPLSIVEARAPWGRRLRLARVEVLLLSPRGVVSRTSTVAKQAREAVEETDRLVWEDPHDARALFWKARALLRLGRRNEAIVCLQDAVVASDGDDGLGCQELSESLRTGEGAKEHGNRAFQNQDYDAALHYYEVALEADRHQLDAGFSSVLFCNLSAVRHKKGQTQAALEDVQRAIAMDPGNEKAHFRAGILYMELRQYQKACAEFDEVARTVPNFEGLGEWRARAKLWSERPPDRDHYAVLGVGFNASSADIKRAYKKAALRWHPDKNSACPERAEEMFKNIREAYDILSDPDQRRQYDCAETAHPKPAPRPPQARTGQAQGWWPGAYRKF